MQHHLIQIFSQKVVFMTRGRRVKLSANQRMEMWSRWKAGQSLHKIGRAFGKDHVSIQFRLSQHGGIVPAARRRSLTWDRGLEMAQHHSFTVATNVKVYFCDPQSPWQRGSNENTNGLLRQYLPKKADWSSYSQSDLDQIALRLKSAPA
jgi:hypothetical protein